MDQLQDEIIDLIITSPPYPMIEMWDPLFSSLNPEIQEALETQNDKKAYHLMHEELGKIWSECIRVLKPGGIICINIGDATRKLNRTFQLYPNHSRINQFFQNHGFISLPCILWRKPTNSPTKFLGSGMIPPNAYVTLEHEYILIFRKGKTKRKFPPKFEKRYNSAFFWEERNTWFSDIWTNIKGVSQFIDSANNPDLRERSAAFPLELPFRLINMYSIYNDTILDPFWGTGTTTIAAMVSGRKSIGFELNSEFKKLFEKELAEINNLSNSLNFRRINHHLKFIKRYQKEGKDLKYTAHHYDFPVITKQEKKILLYNVKELEKKKDKYRVYYEKFRFNSDLK